MKYSAVCQPSLRLVGTGEIPQRNIIITLFGTYQQIKRQNKYVFKIKKKCRWKIHERIKKFSRSEGFNLNRPLRRIRQSHRVKTEFSQKNFSYGSVGKVLILSKLFLWNRFQDTLWHLSQSLKGLYKASILIISSRSARAGPWLTPWFRIYFSAQWPTLGVLSATRDPKQKV